MKNRYIYHYHSYYINNTNKRVDIDGIVQSANPIKTMEEYRELKKEIDQDNIIIISSLSLIGREKD